MLHKSVYNADTIGVNMPLFLVIATCYDVMI